jgi:transcriptional regulator
VKRREVLAGLILGAEAGEGQQPRETIYIPEAQRVEDRALLHEFMEEFPFAELVTGGPGIRVSHVPVWLDRADGPSGTLYGHVAKANHHSDAIAEGQAALLVFRGPHGYIPPGWSGRKDAVPTWNFAVAHAGGKLRKLEEGKALYESMARLVEKMEGRFGEAGYDFAGVPGETVERLMGRITGFALRIETLEGKFKLGQERDAAGRAALVEKLKQAKKERGLGEFTAAFYRRSMRG